MLSSILMSLVVLAATEQPAPNIVQKSSGWCSPNIAYVAGNVTVNCIGVDPRALNRLNAELNRKNLQLADKISEADEWTARYKELEAQLSAAGNDSVLSRQAEEYLHQGELEKAAAILDQILGSEEKQVDVIAANHFNRALVFDLQFRPLDALPHLEKAYQYRPEEWKYGQEYSAVLLQEKEFSRAEPVIMATLDKARHLSNENPAAYRPDLASTLNTLANLYRATQRTKEALATYEEAVEMWRQLAKDNPAAYQPKLARTLNNLANQYSDTQRTKEGEAAYLEALETYRQLATENPAAYKLDVALTRNNLATLYRATQRMKEAEAGYQEALEICSQLAKANPAAYQPYVAGQLNNLAALYRTTQRMKEAEAAYEEALDLYRQSATANHAAYKPAMANVLTNLATLDVELGNLDKASKENEEAVTINRERWRANAESSGNDLARSLLVEAAILQQTQQRNSQVCPLVREAETVAYHSRPN